MARANVNGTGVYVTKGVRQLTGLKWKIESTDRELNTTPAIKGSVVYFGRRGDVYAVDAETGAEKWMRQTHNTSISAPAVAGDTVYVGSREELYALDTDTGSLRWMFEPEKGSDDYYFADPVVDGGTVYFGGWSHFYALDSKTGQQKWKVKLSGGVRSVPAVYDGTVYVGTFSSSEQVTTDLYALDSETGQEKWKLQATGGGIAGAVAAVDGVVYVSTYDEGLLALDAKSGQEKWRYDTGSGLTGAPIVAYGMIYITDKGGFFALDAQTGSVKWQLQADASYYADPVMADGIVYFTSAEEGLASILGGEITGYLHAVDGQSGQELWRYGVGDTIPGALAVSDGAVFFGTHRGTLYAVK